MRDLIAKLEKLEMPDRDIDRIIECEIWFNTPHHAAGAIRDEWNSKPFTSSLDAAIALVERVLPGAYRKTTGPREYLNIPTTIPARFRAEIIGDKGTGVGWHDVEPIAHIIALLQALDGSRCATEGCVKPATMRFGWGGAYCHICYQRIMEISS